MRVNTEELNRQAFELRRIAGRLNDLQDSVLCITRNLARESVGERFLPALSSAAREIGKRADDMGQMRRALQQIAEMYEATEMRILDGAESAATSSVTQIIRAIPIPRWWFPIRPEPIIPVAPHIVFDSEQVENLFRLWDAEMNTGGGSGEADSGSAAIAEAQGIVQTIEAVIRERFPENPQDAEFLIDRQVSEIVDGLEGYEIPAIDWTPWNP